MRPDRHARQFAPTATALVIVGDAGVEQVVPASDQLADWNATEPPAAVVDDRPARAFRV
jgi:predicted Zn-dependent peptidase